MTDLEKDEAILKPLAEVLANASNGHAVPEAPSTPDAYGEKYAELHKSIIANADSVAQRFQDLSEHYGRLAMKVRDDGLKSADRHVAELRRIDRVEEALAETVA